jgi:hypothetical protein
LCTSPAFIIKYYEVQNLRSVNNLQSVNRVTGVCAFDSDPVLILSHQILSILSQQFLSILSQQFLSEILPNIPLVLYKFTNY